MANQASASYWVAMQDTHGNVLQWMWNCETCTEGVGLAKSEPEVIEAMNSHVSEAHPKHNYTATPVPNEE